MPAYTPIFLFLIYAFTPDANAQEVNHDLDYGLEFASHEVIKDHRTSLNLTPETAFHFDKDFTIQFDLAYKRLINAYGYIVRIIANDTLNIDLVSSPEHNDFYDLSLIINNNRTPLHYDFGDIDLKAFQWTDIAIGFSHEKNEISLTWEGQQKIHSFPVSQLQNFRIYFGANDYGKFKTSDVPPVRLKNIELWEENRVVQKWLLNKHHFTQVYDSVNDRLATVTNPVWLLDKHRSWIHHKEFIIGNFPSIAFNSESGLLYAIDTENLYTYDLAKGTIEKQNTVGNPVYTDANQLIYVRETGDLINYDVHTNKFLPFDGKGNSWKHTDTVYHEPEYWHHNKFYNPFDSSVYTFGGYGHFSYKKTFFRYDVSAGQWEPVETEGSIPPRYLGASGLNATKDKILIYGGYGSISGKQELFPECFYDLYSFDLRSRKIHKIWEFNDNHGPEDIVFSNSLVVNEKDSCFYVLTYPKNKYESAIKLRRYSLSNPEYTVLADSLPFRFHDEDAFTDLFLSESENKLIAVTTHKQKDQFHINVYSINYPPLSTSDVLQVIKTKKANATLYYIFTGAGLLGISIMFIRFRKKKSTNSTARSPDPLSNSSAGKPITPGSTEDFKPVSTVNLFGGFQVFDRSGQDITGKFTMTLKELFVLILLYSVKFEKGISATELQEYLWPDKDEVSARNNKNVNIKKLRSLLTEIGDLSIENNNGYLHLCIGANVFCDYQAVFKMLDNTASEEVVHGENIKTILAHVKRGNLLPNVHASWLDSFKSDISNQIIDILLEYSQSLDPNNDSKILIEIADSIFNYDSINQEALVIKCSVLNKKGKYSLAKTWYEHFAKEYKTLYCENYPKSFEEVIS